MYIAYTFYREIQGLHQGTFQSSLHAVKCLKGLYHIFHPFAIFYFRFNVKCWIKAVEEIFKWYPVIVVPKMLEIRYRIL